MRILVHSKALQTNLRKKSVTFKFAITELQEKKDEKSMGKWNHFTQKYQF